MMWLFWILGAVLVAMAKLIEYCYRQDPSQVKLGRAILDYYFKGSTSAAISVLTIGVVWVLGAAYVDKLDFMASQLIKTAPRHPGLAFLLGGVAEYGAPRLLDPLLKKIEQW